MTSTLNFHLFVISALVKEGILHEIWLGHPDIAVTKTWELNRVQPYSAFPAFTHIIEDFTSTSNHSYSVERFRTYFIAPDSGDYTFTVECPYLCALFFKKKYNPFQTLLDITGG